MNPMSNNTKFHFTHPNHHLIHDQFNRQHYFCHGCKTVDSGSRYRCHACNFNLHEYCANLPEKWSSIIHEHDLTLDFLITSDRFCDICINPIEGLFYRCKECNFNAHPLCTSFPKEVFHVIDNNHSLKLRKPLFGTCNVCRTDCSSHWVYGCDICGVNIHIDCLFVLFPSPATQWSGPPGPPPSHGPSGLNSNGIGNSYAPPLGPTQPPPPPYGFDPFGKPYAFNDFGFVGHRYDDIVPYSVPNNVCAYPGFHHGFPNNIVKPLESSSNCAAPPSPLQPRSGGRKLGRKIVSLLGRLASGAITTVVFGTPIGL